MLEMIKICAVCSGRVREEIELPSWIPSHIMQEIELSWICPDCAYKIRTFLEWWDPGKRINFAVESNERGEECSKKRD